MENTLIAWSLSANSNRFLFVCFFSELKVWLLVILVNANLCPHPIPNGDDQTNREFLIKKN